MKPTRPPEAGDFVTIGSACADGTTSGPVWLVERTTANTAWLVEYAGTKKTEIKARRDEYSRKHGPWNGVFTRVSYEEAERWRIGCGQQASAWTAWHTQLPAGARLVMYDSRDPGAVGVAVNSTTSKPDDADRYAAVWTAVAAWLRAKPSPAPIRLAVEVEP